MEEVTAKRRRLDPDDGDGNNCASLETRIPEDFGDRLFKMVTVDGDVFPRFPVQISQEEHIRGIRNMQMREDDVIIASFPNSGARWIWEMTQMLLAGQAEYDCRSPEHVTIELNDVADMDSIPSPRVLNSHLFIRQLSNEIATKPPRVIHVMRNPKDLVVSYYFRMRQFCLFHDKGFQDFAVDFLNSSGCQGTCLDYFTYLYEMMKWQREHPEVPVINIFYEDVHKSPIQSVRDLAHFLQQNHTTDAFCADIVDQCSFHNLKDAYHQAKVKDHPSTIRFRDYNPSFFRKGEVGDWKNHFTMALSEHYDEVIEQRLHQHGLTFQFTVDYS